MIFLVQTNKIYRQSAIFFLTLDRLTEQLDKLYNTDLLFRETWFKNDLQKALGRSVDCETIDWLVDPKTQRTKFSVGQKLQCRMCTNTEYTPRQSIHQGRLYTKVDWEGRQNIHQGRIYMYYFWTALIVWLVFKLRLHSGWFGLGVYF